MPVARHKSKTVPEPASAAAQTTVDQRVARTRDLLDGAFVALLHRRSYEAIRVGDITRKAGVGRATFYAHYATKHDLLESQLRRIVFPMIVVGAEGDCPVDATALFAHVAASPRIYQGLTSGSTGPLVQRMLLRCFEARLQQLLRAQDRRPDAAAGVPDALALHFVASALLTLVNWCIETQATQAPGNTQRVYATLIGGVRLQGPSRPT